MWFLVLPLMQLGASQPPSVHEVLSAEYSRGSNAAAIGTLDRAIASGDTALQRLAARALGRWERAEHAPRLAPLLASPAPAVRRQAYDAAAQMRAAQLLWPRSTPESNAEARGAWGESLGRVATPNVDVEAALATGLSDADAHARRGMARGLESYLRRNARSAKPQAATLLHLRERVQRDIDSEVRLVSLLALTAAGDRDSLTLDAARRDTDPQVRRAAVALSRAWMSDPHPMVRWQALRVAGDCTRAAQHVNDSSEHVRLLAIDLLGEKHCEASLLQPFLSHNDWRRRAHAVLSLARTSPDKAQNAVRELAQSPVWQARAWAAQAAVLIKDSRTLARLASDRDPNVALAASVTVPTALALLTRNHAGAMLQGAQVIGKADSATRVAHAPALRAAFDRIAARGVTWRDPREAIVQALVLDDATRRWMQPLLQHPDPAIARRVALRLSPDSTQLLPHNTVYAAPAFPSATTLTALRGATAELHVAGKGVVHLRLLPDDALMAVHAFVTLAESGTYAGRTLHRIVPNFVVQGGSPGADEYDPATDYFMRDEVGFARNARGSVGISTRGRDTGDGQLYFNLIDNVRLDHDYTVFAHTIRGLDVVDAIQEGDIIERVVIRRASAGAGASGDAAHATSGAASRIEASGDARQPAAGPDNLLAFARAGHVYLQRGAQPAERHSTGSAFHRDPAFAGNTLYYAQDSAGNYDLYTQQLDANGSAQSAQRLTTHAAHDVAPAPLPDGRIVFQRGLGGDARLYVREVDGSERRLGSVERQERRPRISRDGQRVAFLTAGESSRSVVVHDLTTRRDSVVFTDPTLEDVAWGPDDRLAVSLRSGTYVVPTRGQTYSNLVSRRHGEIDWSPDGAWISVAEVRDVSVGYNGDPDRGVDRSSHERGSMPSGNSSAGSAADAGIVRIPAPRAPDDGLQALDAPTATDRSAINAAAFDRMWQRSQQLYFTSPEDASASQANRRAAWEAVRNAYRPRALAASTDSALAQVLHEALRARPALREEARGRAAVSSAHPVATEAGLEMFRRGGNVVDAAVATSFALGVVEPDASGIGGYGEMVIALKGKAPTLIEFMSRVPEAAGLGNTSLLVNGRYPSDGPVLANVPGTVAGMYRAWQQHGSGRLPWAALLAPAIRAARNGYAVSPGLATTLATEREHFAKYAGSRALFFNGDAPKTVGDTIRNPDLAWVLEQIAARGADGFYKGEVASRYATDLRRGGNAMTERDLARYFANEMAPVCGTYRRYRVCSSAPPVSGGADLVARLNLLERFPSPRNYADHAPTLHAALSAWYLTPSSRGKIADPALWPVDVGSVVHKDSARVRWQCFDANRALTPASVRGDTLACLTARAAAAAPSTSPSNDASDVASHDAPCGDDHAAEMRVCHSSGTTAYTVADADGNAVAVTQTLGTWGGNFYVTPGLGFLSNDKLTSYGTDPSQYGSRLPFARHGSTLAPTIAFEGNRPVFAVGAAGNAWITSAVYLTLLGALDYNLGPQSALELPRFLPGGGLGGASVSAFTVQLEDGFAPSVVSRLRALGYGLTFVSAYGELREGYGAAVRIGRGQVWAGADPRRAGAAGAVKQ
jgi:gamma-glutamyltranspeptidase